MITVPVKIVRLSDDAVVPEYATIGSAGFDLVCIEPVVLTPFKPVLVKTGLKVQIPRGFELQVRPRSGLALKEGITVLNTPGTVDSDYRGEVCVILQWNGYNPHLEMTGDSAQESICPECRFFKRFKYLDKGTRIAQGVIANTYHARFEVVEELDETERGEGGFGSTGVQ